MVLHVLLVALLATASASVPAAAEATASMRRDSALRVNVAARQRMLTQRLAKSACFAAIGIDPAGHVAEVTADLKEFQKGQLTLEYGSVENGLMAEDDSAVVRSLQPVRELWPTYASRLTAVAGATVGGAAPALQPMFETSLELLLRTDDALAILDDKYGDGLILRPGLSNAIVVAGRQRMLSEKMLKEVCLVAAGYDVAQMTRQLQGTIALFRSSDTQLRHRLRGLALGAEATARIAAQHDLVDALWREVEPVLVAIADGRVPTPAELDRLAVQDAALLDSLDDLVQLYEAAA
jgi:hypothetical protein